jgi:inner membrane protein
MDSVTQAVLGAAIGEAALGRRVGRRAAAWGAVLGTLPDLDVLIPRGGPVADFTYHRTETHSLLYLTLAAPLLAWAIHRLHRNAPVPAGAPPGTRPAGFRDWWLLAWLALFTHPLLDALTIYGTQLGLPFTDHPFGTGSVFVLDPTYTLPVLLGLLAALVLPRGRPLGARLNRVGLAVGTAYLAFGLLAQQHVERFARAELARQAVANRAVADPAVANAAPPYERLFATPTPLNGLLWRVVSIDDARYCEGFRSLLDGAAPLAMRCFPRNRAALAPVADLWATRRLQWFTQGWYAAVETPSVEGAPPGASASLVLSDLRMGQEPRYVFAFVLGDVVAGRTVPRVPEVQAPFANTERSIGWVFRRILDPSLPPPG